MTEGRRAAAEPLETRRETITVQIEGELDHFSAERVRAMLDALISDAHVKRLVIDLSKLTFMDSSGIGVMLGRYRHMARRGGTLAVRGVSPQVDRIFRMSGLYQIIEKCR